LTKKNSARRTKNSAWYPFALKCKYLEHFSASHQLYSTCKSNLINIFWQKQGSVFAVSGIFWSVVYLAINLSKQVILQPEHARFLVHDCTHFSWYRSRGGRSCDCAMGVYFRNKSIYKARPCWDRLYIGFVLRKLKYYLKSKFLYIFYCLIL
jgi:hypothetical protein